MKTSSDLNETLLRSEPVYDGVLLKVFRDFVAMPDGHEEIREVIRHPGASIVIPHLGDHRYVMVHQYRHAVGRVTLEFPAGRLDPDENPVTCAVRELAEETGYAAGRLEHLFSIHPAPGYSDELIYVFKAEDLKPGRSHPDPDECLAIAEVTLEELQERFRQREITDSKTLNALFYLQLFD
jgi:ADP-ribose pyrophosphatase